MFGSIIFSLVDYFINFFKNTTVPDRKNQKAPSGQR